MCKNRLFIKGLYFCSHKWGFQKVGGLNGGFWWMEINRQMNYSEGNQSLIRSSWFKSPPQVAHVNVPKCLTSKYTNAQIHKYTNTVWVKLTDRWIIQEEIKVSSGRADLKARHRLHMSMLPSVWHPNTQMHKYTNTQIKFGSN